MASEFYIIKALNIGIFGRVQEKRKCLIQMQLLGAN